MGGQLRRAPFGPPYKGSINGCIKTDGSIERPHVAPRFQIMRFGNMLLAFEQPFHLTYNPKYPCHAHSF